MKKLLYDRRDGWRIKHKDPIMRLIPYIMPKRYDAQVFFDDAVDIANTEVAIKAMRKEGHRVIFLHIVLAAILRTMVDFPKVNRFVKGRKVYARKELSFCFALKRAFDIDAEETIVKLAFKPEDTLLEVIERVNTAIGENKDADNRNKTDKAARVLNFLPSGLIRFAIFLANQLDNHRLMPKFLINASPFHTSAFVTDLGSIGLRPVYHHIYDFGTTSIFFAFGTKKREVIVERDQSIKQIRQLEYRLVIDERIGDGFYMSHVLKRFKKYLQNPDIMMSPPSEVTKDDEIR